MIMYFHRAMYILQTYHIYKMVLIIYFSLGKMYTVPISSLLHVHILTYDYRTQPIKYNSIIIMTHIINAYFLKCKVVRNCM